MPQMSGCVGSSPGMNGCIHIICWSDAASQEYFLVSSLGSCTAAHLGLHAEMKFLGNIQKMFTQIGPLHFHNDYFIYAITFF